MENKQFSSLWEYYKNRGARFSDESEQKMILNFGNPETEYRALYAGAALRDSSGRTILGITGKDMVDFLHRVSTNDLKSFREGETRRTLFLTDRGRIVDSVNLFHRGGEILCLGSTPERNLLAEWLDKYIIMDDVRPADVAEKYAVLEIWGPGAGRVLGTLDIRADAVPGYGYFGMVHCAGSDAIISRFTAGGRQEHFRLIVDRTDAPDLLDRIHDTLDPEPLLLCGEEAFLAFRIEQGIPEAPSEINLDYNPHDLNLLDAVSFSKGCYIGQEVVERMDALGKAGKSLSGIIFSGAEMPGHESLRLENEDGDTAGTITSVAFSPALGKVIGMGVVKKSAAATGSRVVIRGSGGFTGKGTIAAFPLV